MTIVVMVIALTAIVGMIFVLVNKMGQPTIKAETDFTPLLKAIKNVDQQDRIADGNIYEQTVATFRQKYDDEEDFSANAYEGRFGINLIEEELLNFFDQYEVAQQIFKDGKAIQQLIKLTKKNKVVYLVMWLDDLDASLLNDMSYSLVEQDIEIEDDNEKVTIATQIGFIVPAQGYEMKENYISSIIDGARLELKPFQLETLKQGQFFEINENAEGEYYPHIIQNKGKQIKASITPCTVKVGTSSKQITVEDAVNKIIMSYIVSPLQAANLMVFGPTELTWMELCLNPIVCSGSWPQPKILLKLTKRFFGPDEVIYRSTLNRFLRI